MGSQYSNPDNLLGIEEKQSEFILLDNKLIIGDCNFQCLGGCPLPPGMDCLWDDPDIGMSDLVEYPEFFWWREDNKKLVRPEPKDPMQTRCPRCFSTQVVIGYPYIECKHCGYNEPLIDFPISYDYHLALSERR